MTRPAAACLAPQRGHRFTNPTGEPIQVNQIIAQLGKDITHTNGAPTFAQTVGQPPVGAQIIRLEVMIGAVYPEIFVEQAAIGG